MAIRYKIVEKKNPLKREEPGKFYAEKVSLGVISTEQIANEIADRAGQSVGTVKGLLIDIQKEVANKLKNGFSVKLGEIGTIRTSIKGYGSTTEAEYNINLVRSIPVRLVPSPHMKNQLKLDKLNFEKIDFTIER